MRKLLMFDDLAKHGIKYSRPQIWRLCKQGSFPAPIKLGANRNAWIEEEIDRWIDSKIEERDTGPDQ